MNRWMMVTVLSSSLIFAACQSTSLVTPQQTSTALLQNQTWILTSIGNSQVRTPAHSPAPSIQFDPATQQVSGHDGCNRFFGTYAVQVDKISMSPLAGTKMFCAQSQTLANEYHVALKKVAAYQAYGKTLRLLDRHGNPLLQFESAQ